MTVDQGYGRQDNTGALGQAAEDAGLALLLSDEDQLLSHITPGAIALLDLPANLAHPGTPMASIAAHLLQKTNRQTDDLDSMIAAELRRLENGAPMKCEQAPMPDVMLDVNRQRLPDGSSLAQYQPQSDWRLLHETLVNALEEIPEAFVIYDAEGRLVMCNQNFRDMYDYTAEETKPGTHFRTLGEIDVKQGNVDIRGQDDEEYLAQKAIYRRELKGSFLVHLKDGRQILTRDRRTAAGGFVSIQTDVTESYLLQEKLKAAKKAADIASRTKSNFLANISHELRSPLNAIIGFAEVIEGHQEWPESHARFRDYASDIRQAGKYLLELINDIIDVARLKSGETAITPTTVNVREAVSGAMRRIEERAYARGLKVAIDLPDDAPQSLWADERYLRQMLVNLLTNAVKFTPANGTITISAAYSDTGDSILSVSDTGTGIADEYIEGVTDLFRQIDEGADRRHPGVGIGLALVKGLMELHGGELNISSKLGHGTTVSLVFPKTDTP